MRKPSALPGLIFVLIILVGFGIAYATSGRPVASAVVAIVTVIVAVVVSSSVKVADQWEKVVVLRLGRFRSLEGPGLFFIIPIVESV
ncbi:MAG: slipin family protein, partial [Roseiarcus sp.]